MTLTPVHSFPIMTADYRVVDTERRTYDDRVVIKINRDGVVVR